MDPRLPYALGALAGMVRADAANEAASGSPDGTVSDAMRSALTVADQLRRGPGGVHAIRSGQWSVPAGSARDRLLCAVPIGIAMSTIDPEALAETVWIACRCTNQNEFQSAALLAAAVSLLINNRDKSPITTLCDAVDVVSAMKPRGESQEGPDVLTATKRALNVQANSHSPLVRVRMGTLMAKLADISSSHRIIPLAFFQVLYLWAKELPPACREVSGDPALYDAVSAALAGVCDTRKTLRDLDAIPVEGVSHIDVLGIAEQLLALSAPTPLEWIRRAAGLAPDHPPRSGPSSFEEPGSDLLNRYAPFEPESAPTPLGSSRGNAPVGRVVVMSELLLRFDRHSKDDTVPAEDEWATREDVHLALPFTAMCAAHAMGVEVVSLSPIGQGPRASIIAEALAREGIIDAGPRVEGCDNGFLSPPLKQYGASVSSGMTEMPEDAWDEAIRTLGPSDVLFVDGGIVSQAVLAACEHALAHLPDHVRVVLDASQGHVRQRSLPNDNVLIMVGYDSAESLCRSVSYERPSGDCTKYPRTGADKVPSDFHQNTLVRAQTHESYLARAVQDKYSSDGEVTRFPAPTVTSTDLRGALHTSMGALAAGFALGYTLERSIVLANCAGALASTMPGPASCPSREEVEAAADALKDRGDDYMRRRDRIYGALAGVTVADAVAFPVRGMSPEEIASLYDGRDQLVNASSSHPTTPGAPAGTITQITREVLAAASRLLGEAPSEPADEARAEDGDWLAGSEGA
ncbi:MAG: ADP-ribosylglycohydrolase, partial [Thermobifida sp.]|nr:ADP-ribosylglycohydrolase [Thermobifida sp.]